MPSKFGDIVSSIREVINLEILKVTTPGSQNGRQISKKWKQCDVHKKILSCPEK